MKKKVLPPAKPPMSLVFRPRLPPKTSRNNRLPSLKNVKNNNNINNNHIINSPSPPKSARPIGTFYRNRNKNISEYPTIENAPISADEAIDKYSNILTKNELNEIRNVQEIYYIRQKSPIESKEPLGDDNFFVFIRNDHIKFRYQMISELGRGAFGSVIKCYDHKDQKMVAVKMVKDRPKMHQQILIERDVLMMMKEKHVEASNHHIINVIDSFNYFNFFVFVFELLSSDMYTALQANKFRGLDLSKLQIIGKQIADSIAYVHGLGLIHCDIKPENLLWTTPRKTAVKLIDFGCCCYDGNTLFTYIQSRFYRAPEVILGMPYSQGIDVWSFGCMIVELHTGYPLFPGENEAEQMMLFMSVLGLPPKKMIESAKRGYKYFDDNGKPKNLTNSKGKTYEPSSTPINDILRVSDKNLISLIKKCLKWDPAERIKASEILNHPWFRTFKRTPGFIRSPPKSARA